MTYQAKQTAVSADAAAPAGLRSPGLRRFRDTWLRFCRHRLALLGLVLVLVTVLMALLAPMLFPEGPFKITGGRLLPPSAGHWLGTDHLGRDVLSGVLYGARAAFLVGFLSILMSLAIGIVVGAAAGYYGGWVDDVLMRITEIFQVMPRFFLALLVVAMFGASIWGIVFVIGILSWAEIARLLRAEYLTLRERPFVTAARAYGAPNFQIIVVEILPNASSPIIVAAALQIASAVLLEASLSFLGVGDPNVMSWGSMLNSAQQFLRVAWWSATFPGLAICVMTLGIALMSDGLNDALNPRLKELGR